MASSEINAESVVSHIIESSTSASLFSYFGEVFISSSSNSKSSATIEKLKDELKAAFRKYARIIHPDKCTSPLANKAFVKLKDAYDELLNNISTTVVNNSRYKYLFFHSSLLYLNNQQIFTVIEARESNLKNDNSRTKLTPQTMHERDTC